MAKVIIEFDTEKDEEQDINAALHASKLALCIWEVQQKLRSTRKYTEISKDTDVLIDELYDLIAENIGNIDEYTY